MDPVTPRHQSLPVERSCVQVIDHRRRAVSNHPKPILKPKVVRQSRTRFLFSQVKHTLFSLPAISSEDTEIKESQDFSKELRRLNSHREKLEAVRNQSAKVSLSSDYFSPSLSHKKRIANETRSRNSMHSRSSYTPLDFTSADIKELPSIRLDGPLEAVLYKLLPTQLYLSFRFCMGHPKYFPGDAESELTMPWPSYSLNSSQEQSYDSNEPFYLRASTLNGLIHALSCKGTTDNMLLGDFLRTYHYCISGEDLLRMIFARYINCILDKDSSNAEWNSIVQLKLLNILKKWIHHYQAIIQRKRSLYEFAHGVLTFIDHVEETRARFVASILNDLESKPELESSLTLTPNFEIFYYWTMRCS
ncbi:hypothetical protein DSO57_1002944 [Entomophthora muscae]|uniref:Uncharacterized protein n=1 Tax=Entomophthora muscae TaxID=34485 RepID=A0ACC2T899_9FUNG|nr:hypothetical protein DSO57_1002944 [Entomophthora muscae]